MTDSYVMIKKEQFQPMIDKIKDHLDYISKYNKQFIERMCDIDVRAYIFGLPIGRKVSLYLRSYEKAWKVYGKTWDSLIIRKYGNFDDYIFIDSRNDKLIQQILESLKNGIDYDCDVISINNELISIIQQLYIDVETHKTAVKDNNGKN